MAEPASLDPHDRAVRADYEGRVGQWETIYDGATYHDHLIRDRLLRTLTLVDERLGAADGRRALDVGCGAGQLLVELGRRGFDPLGVDIAPGMVEASRRRLEQAGVAGRVDVGSMTGLPVPDGSVALLTGLGAIEYVAEQAAALREFRRVLAPGGYAVVTAPNLLRAQYLLDPVGAALGFVRTRTTASYPRRYLWAGSLRSLLEQAGFEVVAIQGHGLSPLSLAGRRVVPDATAVRCSTWLEERLPAAVARLLGADLIALARKPGLPRPPTA